MCSEKSGQPKNQITADIAGAGNSVLLQKLCNGCGVEKGLTDFDKNKRGLLGRESHCKNCVSVRKTSLRRKKGQPTVSASFSVTTSGTPSPESLKEVAFIFAEVLKGVFLDEKF